jgi:hypothetical protein
VGPTGSETRKSGRVTVRDTLGGLWAASVAGPKGFPGAFLYFFFSFLFILYFLISFITILIWFQNNSN